MQVFVLKPKEYDTIYGVYSTREKAEKAALSMFPDDDEAPMDVLQFEVDKEE